MTANSLPMFTTKNRWNARKDRAEDRSDGRFLKTIGGVSGLRYVISDWRNLGLDVRTVVSYAGTGAVSLYARFAC